MSSFNNNNVTLKGAVIIASLVAGGTLTFTRIAVGDGVLPSGQTVLTTERLVNHLFDVNIVSVESDSVAHATVKGIFSNADLDTGFYYRELGLYAINPVSGAEELFCYGNAGDDAEWINPTGESSLIEKEIHLVTLIGNATTVTATFDPKTPVLKSEFDAVMPLKADLDSTGQVVKSQLTVPDTLSLYVDVAAAAGGDGTENKPFKTIQAAINSITYSVRQVIINIAPGSYPEDVVVNVVPANFITLRATDTTNHPTIKSLYFWGGGLINLVSVDIVGVNQAQRSLEIAYSTFNLTDVKIDAAGSDKHIGIVTHGSNGILDSCTINGYASAVYAIYGGAIECRNSTLTNNTRDFFADGATIHTDTASDKVLINTGGVVINTAIGEALTKDAYSVLIGENTFRNQALASAMTNSITTLFVEVYADTNDIDKTYTDAASIINSYYDARLHIFEKKDAATVTFYSVVESVTSGNGKAWLFADYTLNGGTIEFAISRDGGTNYTVVTNNQLTDISAKAAGTNMRLRVTITGAVTLRNVAWGCKA